MQVTYAMAGIFCICNNFTKLSLLTFYLHLSPQKWWKIAIWTSLVIVGISGTILIFLLFIHCNPVAKAYNETLDGSCLNAAVIYMAVAVVNIITDLMLFVLPIPMIVQLRMGRVQKIGAIVIFGIGSMTVGTSAVRLALLLKVLNEDDYTWHTANANVWA